MREAAEAVAPAAAAPPPDRAAEGLPDVRPLDAPLGAELCGIDLRRLGAPAFAAVHRAWRDHGVVLIRGQRLTDTDLLAFSRRFGALDEAPVQENGRRFVPGHPELYVVSNVIENGEAIGSLGAGVTPTDDPRAAPGTFHPIGLVHPETGRTALYLGRRRNAWIEGLPLADSESLLDELWSHATDPALAWRHRWRVGNVVLWDNRCTLHRRDPFDPGARRIMHRTQIKG